LNTLGAGFLEKVYENALGCELRKTGLLVAQQQGVAVLYQFPVSATYTVMAGEGPPSTSFIAASYEDVDAGPAPGMTDESHTVGLGMSSLCDLRALGDLCVESLLRTAPAFGCAQPVKP